MEGAAAWAWATERLSECETEPEAFEAALVLADRLLGYDVGVVAAVEAGAIVPQAVDADRFYRASLLDEDAGIAGETIETGEPVIVDDLTERPAVRSVPGVRSVASVAIGDDVVLQALSAAPERYEGMASLAGAIGAACAATIDRIETRETVERERDEFATLFQNLPTPAIRYRIEGSPVIESVNASFVSTFGIEHDAAEGREITDLFSADGSSPLVEQVAIDERERTERPVERRTDAGTRRFRLRHVPASVETGHRDSGYLVYEDVETLRRREEALERQNERLERFASVVSHDIRNPVTVATGHLELLEEGDDGDDAAAEVVRESLERIEQIVDDVLSMARHGQAVVDRDRVSVHAVANEAWGNVDTDGATLVTGPDCELAADRTRLVRLFENLIRNAVEHGSTSPDSQAREDSQPAVTIEIGALSDGDGVYVADDGPGIDPDNREQALVFGYTTDDDGTGYGLAVVGQIATAHGWGIRLTDSDPGGLRVEVGPAVDGCSDRGTVDVTGDSVPK